MAKFADYAIIEVHYPEERKHIESVKARKITETGWDSAEVYLRGAIVAAIEKGTVIATAFSKNGKWEWGAKVEVVLINDVKYIKTMADQEERDNLGKLPEF